MIVIAPINDSPRSYQRYPSFLSAWTVAPMSDTHLSYEPTASIPLVAVQRAAVQQAAVQRAAVLMVKALMVTM